MKLKSKIIMYLCMLVLCMSFMVYGVYSAMTASLKVSGSLGFKAHNCQGTAELVSVEQALNADGTEYVINNADKNKKVTWESGTALTITDAMYFDDISTRDPQTGEYLNANIKIKPIIITLKMTNTSAFAIKADAKTAPLQTNDATPVDISGITYSYNVLSLASGANNGTFQITLTPDVTTLTSTLSVTAFTLTVDIGRNV